MIAHYGATEPHTRREYAVECVGCGVLVLERVGSFLLPWCRECKAQYKRVHRRTHGGERSRRISMRSLR
jgi:hypothetical protein